MSDGTWLRHRADRTVYSAHECRHPDWGSLNEPSGHIGDVWRCGFVYPNGRVCGRRWVICLGDPHAFETKVWKRRWLPWPR